MESRVGFFGQFGCVFKGIVKPRFFNRLSNQPNVLVVIYTIIMLIISTAVFWGIMYLRCISGNGFISKTEEALSQVPQFSYSAGQVTFEENTSLEGYGFLEGKMTFVFNSDVETMDPEYKNKVEILSDKTIGKQVWVFNKTSFSYFNAAGGVSTLKYSIIPSFVGVPATMDREGLINFFKQKFLIGFLIVAGVSVIIPNAIKTVALAFFFGGIGFGIVKIVKQPYSYKELVKISLYITGFTNIIRYALNASPVKPPSLVLNILFILIVSAYLVFAIIGSTEEAGPTKTIAFNFGKSGGGGLSDEIPAPDPFAKKNYSSGFSRKTETASADTSSSDSFGSSFTSTVQSPSSSSTGTGTASALFTSKSTGSESTSTGSMGGSLYRSSTPASTTSTESVGSAVFTPKSESSESVTARTPFTFAPKSEAGSTAYSETETTYAEPETTYAEPEQTAYYAEPEQTEYYAEPEQTEYYAEPEQTEYYAEPEQTEYYAEPEQPVYAEPEPTPEPVSAVIKSDIGTFGGLGGINSSGSTGKKSKPKYDRPITAPDAYNGLYYSGSDSEESYESNYGSGTLLDRGGLYGKTIGAPESSANPFASVLGVTNNTTSTTTSSSSYGSSTLGGSLYSNHHEDASSSQQPHEHVSFTTKGGSTPFGNDGFFLSNPPKNGSTPKPNTVKKGGKTVNRYSDDDFAAWEREAYAEEFSKPRGGFGNNIF